MEGPKTKWTHRRLGPVKYLKKRNRRQVGVTFEDLERIKANAAYELANKQAHEASYFTTNF